MDYLVLHTPEDKLPNALREKKQQQRPANTNLGGAVIVPNNQKAFLAPPIVVMPGERERERERDCVCVRACVQVCTQGFGASRIVVME